MNRRAAAALAALALLAGAGALAAAGGPGPLAAGLRAAAKRALGWPALRRRAAERSGEPPFARLAASQVGYGPAMAKRFTSPRPFESFEVVSEGDGAVVLRGGAGVAIRSDVLGPPGTAAFEGNLDALATPGRYRIRAAGLESFPFDVGPRVFDASARALLRSLYYQRAFTAIEAPYAEGPWVHPSDAHLAPSGVVKGWHDAGDLSIYSASMTSTLFWLLEAWSDFAPPEDDLNLPESGNGVPDLLDEARWGLEWMLSVEDGGGGFRNTTCQEGYGPYGRTFPHEVPPYRHGEVGGMATARAVGTLGYAAAVFAPHDAAFAARCLAAARRGHAWLAAHPDDHSDGPTCPALRQDGDVRAGRDARAYAAAGLLIATGEPALRDEVHALLAEIENEPSYDRLNVYASLVYLRAPAADPARAAAIHERLRQAAERARADGGAHPFGWAGRYGWGSIRLGFQRTSGFSAKRCLADPSGARADCEQALANVHYALGRNLLQRCYVSGLPGVTRGRTRAFHHWLAALGADPFLFPGLVAGGPMAAPPGDDRSYPHARPLPVWGYWGDPREPRDGGTPLDARHTDNDSWSTNELDVEWQAVTLHALLLARRLARGGAAGDGAEPGAGGPGPPRGTVPAAVRP